MLSIAVLIVLFVLGNAQIECWILYACLLGFLLTFLLSFLKLLRP